MIFVRSVIRILLIAFATGSIYLVYVIFFIFVKLFRGRYEPLRNRIMKFWAVVIARILNVKVEVKGKPPKAPFFLVSNHLSYLDIIPIYLTLKCTFIARKDIRSWPVIGFIVQTMGIIFIDRQKKFDVSRVNKIISESLNQYQGIVLFPEGTTSDGRDVLPFRPPLLEHPAASELEVHYCTITYKTEENDLPASESICWWGDISFPAHMYKLAGTRGIYCTITFGVESVADRDRKILAERLYQKVRSQFEPVQGLSNEALIL